MTPHLVVAAPDTLADRFTARCRSHALAAVAARGRFALAVPGGSVARTFLPRLAAEPMPWERTGLYWSDERAVPVDDPDSNAGLVRSLWRGTSALSRAQLHPMDGGAADPAAAARRYAGTLEAALGTPPRLDLLLLGVGEDGHVASLFPGHPALAEESRWVVAVTDAPKPPPCRLTITLPVIEAAAVVCVAAFGAAKAAPLRAALTEPASGLPVARALRRAAEAWVFLDPAAADGLPADATRQAAPRA